jgi:hypothetical protein
MGRKEVGREGGGMEGKGGSRKGREEGKGRCTKWEGRRYEREEEGGVGDTMLPSSRTTTASGWKPMEPSGFTVSACRTAIFTTPRSKREETIPGSYKSCSPSWNED